MVSEVVAAPLERDVRRRPSGGDVIDGVDALFQALQKNVPFPRQDVPGDVAEQDREPLVPHLSELRDDTAQHRLGFPERRLFVVKRVEQAEDNGRARPEAAEKKRQTAHGRLHLVAGESAGDEHPAEEEIRVDPLLAGVADKRVDVETVTAVDDRDPHSPVRGLREQKHREREDPLFAVEEGAFAPSARECAHECPRLHRRRGAGTPCLDSCRGSFYITVDHHAPENRLMCGRYALVDGLKVFMTFQAMKAMKTEGKVFEILPRYNAAPMQTMPVVAVRGGDLRAEPMRWWLVPHWSKDGKPVASTFNAKAETLGQSRLFSPYFKGSRCLVPADAFYEWQKVSSGAAVPGKRRTTVEKVPYAVRMNDEAPFMFAGLFSVWKNAKEEEFPSFTIITTEPNDLMAPIHNRMPVILPEQQYAQWLDREYRDTDALAKLLVPYPARAMKAFPVSTIVSNSRNDSPACLVPAELP